MPTLRQLLKAKDAVFNRVDDFLESIKSTEVNIYSRMLKILRSFSRDGTLEADGTNLQTLNMIRREVLSQLSQSTLRSKLDKFLVNFDEIENLNLEAYEQILGGNFSKLNVSTEKRIFVNDITDAITSQSVLNAQYAKPIRQLLYLSITRGLKFNEAKEQLRNFILGQDGKLGRLRSYVGQVTTDALNGYDGAVNDLIRDANGLTHFRYVGSLIETSRSNCRHMINGTGPFAQYSLGRGVYRVSDIQNIIDAADKGSGSGFNDAVTPQTFGQIRMGYNCRHAVIYFNYDEPAQQREIDRFNNRI